MFIMVLASAGADEATSRSRTMRARWLSKKSL
jgi:hypothetical protein